MHASGVSTEPVIVCVPFLNASRRATVGTVAAGAIDADSGPKSRVCGTERAKATSITNAIMAAEIQRRMRFIPL
ncbi:TPA: hypothetical protein DIV48_01425 [Candidatus Kaiserbacteria bacterium]|nr:hypothetical protein [Candidatus Kaiserbacteria bacterium]